MASFPSIFKVYFGVFFVQPVEQFPSRIPKIQERRTIFKDDVAF
ncbi:hypothetical protein SAMN05421740_10143 [Parapedobacter koreensis]|uniref:Uncharacterized protein n=1 Tax=Parapedobacter koreensis TaxID=332977 RepID=A0A1H7F3Z8_9SPHI|nr:hypothetical protein SAMN05421740_10143 [Parapedobacter koreensis]